MADKDSTKTQLDKFKEAARAAGTDDSEEAFDAMVKKIAKAPPPKDKSKRAPISGVELASVHPYVRPANRGTLTPSLHHHNVMFGGE